MTLERQPSLLSRLAEFGQSFIVVSIDAFSPLYICGTKGDVFPFKVMIDHE